MCTQANVWHSYYAVKALPNTAPEVSTRVALLSPFCPVQSDTELAIQHLKSCSSGIAWRFVSGLFLAVGWNLDPLGGYLRIQHHAVRKLWCFCFRVPLALCKSQTLDAAKDPRRIVLPPPCLTTGVTQQGTILSLTQLCTKSLCDVWSVHPIISRPAVVLHGSFSYSEITGLKHLTYLLKPAKIIMSVSLCVYTFLGGFIASYRWL